MQSAAGAVREEIALGASEASTLSARSVATTASVRATAVESISRGIQQDVRLGALDSLQGFRSSPSGNFAAQVEDMIVSKDSLSNAFTTGVEEVLNETDPSQVSAAGSSVTNEAKKLLESFRP